ncbi:DEKNAAC100966 [Brettanomyces naardenensis]|uniref:DEKNAAC100966 n=1 Tax=Brettanomyces naardenensis TaxID=13370 RepID=A0A448YGS8_BRENA|nr:DEKNAAC100966 [Brettanomyces naardenensis]
MDEQSISSGVDPLSPDENSNDSPEKMPGEDPVPLQEAPRERRHSSHSIVRIITSDIENELRVIPSIQEKEVEYEIGPLEPQFWKPQNIMSVEDTPFSRRYLVLLEVIFGSVLGNMARIGMTLLTSYSNEYINYHPGTCLWSNFSACFVMAWCNHAAYFWHNILRNSGKTNMKQVALHTGITAGFCGSFSTWSSLLIEVLFKTLDGLNGGNLLPNHGYGVMEFFSVLLVQMGVSFLGYLLGKDFAALLDIWSVSRKLSTWFNYRICRAIELTTSFLGIAALIADLVVGLTIPLDTTWKTKYAFSLIFGAFGAVLRFRLSKYNGSFGLDWFPSGTLMANVMSCTLISILYLLLYGIKGAATIVTGQVHRMIVNAFSAGFCGALSTTSSFVNELYNLDYPFQRYGYFSVTFLICFLIMLLIDGPYFWTKGFIES